MAHCLKLGEKIGPPVYEIAEIGSGGEAVKESLFISHFFGRKACVAPSQAIFQTPGEINKNKSGHETEIMH